MKRKGSPDNQFAYWDRVAEEKEFTHPLNEALFLRLVDRQARVLDYGCGYGRTCRELDRLGYARVTGVDTSKQMIRRGRKMFPRVDLRHPELGSDGALPLKTGAFGAVILFAVLTCIPGDAGQRRLTETAWPASSISARNGFRGSSTWSPVDFSWWGCSTISGPSTSRSPKSTALSDPKRGADGFRRGACPEPFAEPGRDLFLPAVSP